ncbi:hypothetical protein [Bacteroides sp. 51]|uniref:hypothetical protein n=1 Tax=Bacteroides sp. 51 TaxID=2302938 RepID=UPI001EF2075A|nr:hypothetical protein [Bacteroides sp. 51]
MKARIVAIKVTREGIEITKLPNEETEGIIEKIIGEEVELLRSKMASNELLKEEFYNEDELLEKISKKSGREKTECSCDDCKEQCKTPCLGTPKDILRLIDAGFINELKKTVWMVGATLGECPPIPMIQIKTENGRCVFQREDGLCKLHPLGLKPMEGKLSYHTITMETFEFGKSISWNVARQWADPRNIPVVILILHKLSEMGRRD